MTVPRPRASEFTEDDFDNQEYLAYACYILDEAKVLAALDPDFRNDLERIAVTA